MPTKQQIADLADGTRTARQIADLLGCSAPQVHKCADRYSLVLKRHSWGPLYQRIYELEAENARLQAALDLTHQELDTMRTTNGAPPVLGRKLTPP